MEYGRVLIRRSSGKVFPALLSVIKFISFYWVWVCVFACMYDFYY
jgi:hypothetical protein